ncbi:MAG: hypothetical protein R3301_03645 [Saprospiraceae bacterium]|nr:hypothetical protein [Saprospiraceae bacterium]
MALNTPFDYNQYLIGEEIIFRALTQQRSFAGQGKYGMKWTQADEADRTAYEQAFGTARGHFVNVPSHCVPYPPCPWDKNNDRVTHGQFKDIIMLADGNLSYQFKVQMRTDQGTSSFTLGQQVIDYTPDQDALDPSIQAQFRFFKKETNSASTGTAAIVIEKYSGGTLTKTFYYLFDLEQ